jgi:hypothetical protein
MGRNKAASRTRSRTCDRGIDRIDNTYENHLFRSDKFAHHPQDAFSVRLAGHLEVEPSDIHLEKIRQESRIVDVRTMSRIPVATRTDMDANPAPLVGCKALQNPIVECDEATQKASRRIELEG